MVLLAASLFLPLPPNAGARSPVHTVRVTDRFGGVLRVVGSDGRHQFVSIDRVPDIAIRSLVATEDRDFYNHKGVSFRALGRALISNARNRRVVSGGSTITMQVARALRKKTRRGIVDKILEIHLAVRLELHHSKDEILEIWLNKVSFGNRLFGIEEAALFYFGKNAVDLTAAESTLLVGLPQSPSRLNPLRHMDRALARRHTVIDASVRDSVLSRNDADELKRTIPTLATRKPGHFQAPHFVDHVRLSNNKQWAHSTEIRTTIDPQLQATVEKLGQTHLASVNSLGVSNVAVVVLDNTTGEILAYLGSADYWDEQSLGQNDGVQALRQPGSALKPFVYASAFRRGLLSPLSILADIPLHVPGSSGAFSPQNYDQKFHGPVSARTALACSYNIPAVRVAQLVSPEEVLSDLHSVGFTSLDRSASRYGVGLVLGNGEVTLLELARAYAALARGGELPFVKSVDWALSVAGDTLHRETLLAQQTVFTPQISYLITDILSDPEAREPAFGRGGPLELPFDCAAKTGTSKDYRDNFSIGYTPRFTVAVWAGNFDGSPMKRVSGISGAGPLMKAVLLELGPAGQFDRPDHIQDSIVCDESGNRPGRFCSTISLRPTLASKTPTDTCDIHVIETLDSRTGAIAHRATPAEFRQKRTRSILPPTYDNWLNSNGLSPVIPVDSDQTNVLEPSLQVTFPANGSMFQIDPVLRRDYQRIVLSAVVSPLVRKPEWWIDGVRATTDFASADWRLEPGWHVFEVSGLLANGKEIRSSPSRIFVASNSDSGPEETYPASN